MSVAANSASLRRARVTVPAWPSSPVTSTEKRRDPWIAVTTPMVLPRASSSGPCSIWASTNEETLIPSGRSIAPGTRARVRSSAAATVTPSWSFIFSTSSSLLMPAKTEEPMVPSGKRAPPSSQVHTAASIARLVSIPASSIASIASRAASTP